MSSSSITLSVHEGELFKESQPQVYSDTHGPSTTEASPPPTFNYNELSEAHTSPHQYTLLTTEVITQHQHNYSHTPHDQPTDHFIMKGSFPYTRFSSYEPLIDGDTNLSKPHTKHQPQAITPLSNNTSYASTPSHDATPSYNSTASVVYNNTPSSTQAEPELVPYTYAHTSYWCQEELGQSNRLSYDIAYVGAQFNVGSEKTVVETGNV